MEGRVGVIVSSRCSGVRSTNGRRELGIRLVPSVCTRACSSLRRACAYSNENRVMLRRLLRFLKLEITSLNANRLFCKGVPRLICQVCMEACALEHLGCNRCCSAYLPHGWPQWCLTRNGVGRGGVLSHISFVVREDSVFVERNLALGVNCAAFETCVPPVVVLGLYGVARHR